MKTLFIILLIISFISIALFGVFSMHAEMQNHNDNCIAAAVQGTGCPEQTNPFNYLAFHFDAFKYFLIAIFSNNAIFSLILSLLILIAGFAFKILFWNFSPPKPNFVYQRFKQLNSSNSPLRQKLLQWLAFCNNSPNAL